METCRKAFIIFSIMFAIPSGVENTHFNSGLTGGPGGPGMPCGPSLPWNKNTFIFCTCIPQSASPNKVYDWIESQGQHLTAVLANVVNNYRFQIEHLKVLRIDSTPLGSILGWLSVESISWWKPMKNASIPFLLHTLQGTPPACRTHWAAYSLSLANCLWEYYFNHLWLSIYSLYCLIQMFIWMSHSDV